MFQRGAQVPIQYRIILWRKSFQQKKSVVVTPLDILFSSNHNIHKSIWMLWFDEKSTSKLHMHSTGSLFYHLHISCLLGKWMVASRMAGAVTEKKKNLNFAHFPHISKTAPNIRDGRKNFLNSYFKWCNYVN